MDVFLTSTVVAGIVAAVAAMYMAERRIKVENITAERANWREKIRELAEKVHLAIIKADESQLSALRSAFALRLNPRCPMDQAIVRSIVAAPPGREEEQAKEFAVRVSLLLKHDWERAKQEVHPTLDMPVRESFEEHLKRNL